jgi:hypothetical protein
MFKNPNIIQAISRKSLSNIARAIFFLLFFSSVFTVQVMASELSITPPDTKLWSLSPGEQVITQFSVTNDTGIPLLVSFDKAEYLAIQDKYVYPPLDVNSCSFWLTAETATVDLAPSETKYIDLLIRVPEGASTGAYTPVLFSTYTSSTSITDKKTEIQLAPSFKVPINVVSTDTNSELELKLTTDNIIFTFTPPSFQILAKNTGNTYLSPLLRLQVISPAMDRILDETINPGLALIYPGTDIEKEYTLTDLDLNSLTNIGRYEIQLLGEDTSAETSTFTSVTFYVIPPIFLLFILLLVALVSSSVLLTLYRRRKKRMAATVTKKETFKT